MQSSQGGDAPTDDNLARLRSSTARTVRRCRWKQVRFGTMKAPSNGVGQPTTVTPNMLAALCNKLVDSPCMRLKDMVTFLRKEFDADVTRSSVSRAIKSVDYTKEITRDVAKERNPDLKSRPYIRQIIL